MVCVEVATNDKVYNRIVIITINSYLKKKQNPIYNYRWFTSLIPLHWIKDISQTGLDHVRFPSVYVATGNASKLAKSKVCNSINISGKYYSKSWALPICIPCCVIDIIYAIILVLCYKLHLINICNQSMLKTCAILQQILPVLSELHWDQLQSYSLCVLNTNTCMILVTVYSKIRQEYCVGSMYIIFNHSFTCVYKKSAYIHVCLAESCWCLYNIGWDECMKF